MKNTPWLWPGIILVSTFAVALVTFIDGWNALIRGVIAAWFLLIIPGMAFIHMLQVADGFMKVTLAIALSLAIDALVAIVMVLTGRWSIPLGVSILMVLSVIGLLFELRNRLPQVEEA